MSLVVQWKEELVDSPRNPGFQLAARVTGPDDGEPWLLLHGFLDNAGTWERFAAEFDPSARLVCLDFAGHGKSAHIHDGVYHMVDYVGDVVTVADHMFGSRQFSLVGHSMGGGVAVCVAGTFPERVKRLVLVEALGPWARPLSETASNLAKALTKKPSGQQKVFATVHDAAKRRSEGNFVNHLPVDAAVVLCERGLKRVDDGFAWSSDSRLLTPSRMSLHEEQVLAFLSSIASPTLLVLAKDGLFQRLYSVFGGVSPFSLLGGLLTRLLFVFLWVRAVVLGNERARKHIAGVQFVLTFRRRVQCVKGMTQAHMASGGHHPHLTRPKEVAMVVREWLDKGN